MHIKKRAFNFEEEALLASGIQDRFKIDFYVAELDRIYQQFLHQMIPPPDPVQKAKALFTWLWLSKPDRYKPQGNYRLNKVIEAQLKRDAKFVGNCLGLTLLYNCLLRKMDIWTEALNIVRRHERDRLCYRSGRNHDPYGCLLGCSG